MLASEMSGAGVKFLHSKYEVYGLLNVTVASASVELPSRIKPQGVGSGYLNRLLLVDRSNKTDTTKHSSDQAFSHQKTKVTFACKRLIGMNTEYSLYGVWYYIHEQGRRAEWLGKRE